ncbi:HAD family hydrolase [Marinospirillum alkaliphilum]|uniref:Histidinol-phosphatase n=1 Tax=Marinospirillum alkaliphilum DSM 21637 TaxID=1122209 RepID=A0A1K1W0S9_9GAMM|nr:HAD family hydrolase [Marinospirillum alkaliphilum]SFX30823.1 HAD-superfamily subfamily IB hydrolase, TIGR01490 [Marinospirillum alkaliphilum DSM 21637]
MSLALFDLDNTLIAGDSDHAWGEFLVHKGLVNGEEYKKANDLYYAAYQQGTLDIHDYLSFSLRPLTQYSTEEMLNWRKEFIHEHIRPLMLPAAMELLDKHRQAGDRLLIITATNRFITAPIAELLGVSDLIAVEPEFIDGRYTGQIVGTPSFREGKVTCLHQWLQAEGMNLDGSWFYSDSHNDLPLLQQVDNPVAVDPDDTLRSHAEQQGWPVISLRS